jgi:hypothetical protein
LRQIATAIRTANDASGTTAAKLLRGLRHANEQIAMFIYGKELIFTVVQIEHTAVQRSHVP